MLTCCLLIQRGYDSPQQAHHQNGNRHSDLGARSLPAANQLCIQFPPFQGTEKVQLFWSEQLISWRQCFRVTHPPLDLMFSLVRWITFKCCLPYYYYFALFLFLNILEMVVKLKGYSAQFAGNSSLQLLKWQVKLLLAVQAAVLSAGSPSLLSSQKLKCYYLHDYVHLQPAGSQFQMLSQRYFCV